MIAMRSFSKKQLAVAGTATVILVGGGTAAYAYWTTTGSGTGTASTGDSTTTTVNQVSAPSNMAPGVSPGAITFNVENDSATQSAYVTNVTISIAGISDAGTDSSKPACTPADYVLTQPTWTPVELAPGATSADNATATLGFANTAANQDNCKGATVNLAYTAN